MSMLSLHSVRISYRSSSPKSSPKSLNEYRDKAIRSISTPSNTSSRRMPPNSIVTSNSGRVLPLNFICLISQITILYFLSTFHRRCHIDLNKSLYIRRILTSPSHCAPGIFTCPIRSHHQRITELIETPLHSSPIRIIDLMNMNQRLHSHSENQQEYQRSHNGLQKCRRFQSHLTLIKCVSFPNRTKICSGSISMMRTFSSIPPFAIGTISPLFSTRALTVPSLPFTIPLYFSEGICAGDSGIAATFSVGTTILAFPDSRKGSR